MNVYLSNIETAAIVFPILALVITAPYMIVEYRKYGSVPPISSLIVYTFVFYMLCAYFMVILPLPADRSAIVAYAQTPQLHLFNFVHEIARQNTAVLSSPASWPAFFKTPAVYEAIFNVALTVPLGAYLRYCFRCRWWQALLIGFATTLFFELSQFTGLWGIYAHPYRLFDVDDLFLNTLGAVVGWAVAGPFMRTLPDLRALSVEARDASRRASATHRALSFGIDVVVATLLEAVGTFAAGEVIKRIGHLGTAEAFACALPWTFLAAFALVFVAVPAFTGGRTLGQLACRLRVVRPDASQAHWYHYLGRYGLICLLALLPLAAILWIALPGDAAKTGNQLVIFISNNKLAAVVAWLMCMVFWTIVLVVRAAISAIKKEPFVMLTGLLSSTRVMTEAGVKAERERRRATSIAGVRKMERAAEDSGTSVSELMARAGNAVANEVKAWFADPQPVVVFAGDGNNGGDAWACAHELASCGYSVSLITSVAPERMSSAPARDIALAAIRDAASANLSLHVLVDPPIAQVERALDSARVVVDGLLGSDFSGVKVEEPVGEWIDAANARRFRGRSTRRHGRHAVAYERPRHVAAQKMPDKVRNAPVVIAIDVPSGLNADTGVAASSCFVADVTVVMMAYKMGLIEPRARAWVGTCTLATLGVEDFI